MFTDSISMIMKCSWLSLLKSVGKIKSSAYFWVWTKYFYNVSNISNNLREAVAAAHQSGKIYFQQFKYSSGEADSQTVNSQDSPHSSL